MNPLPEISVVIPCYNAERFLVETLNSVVRQTHGALEVLVVDDGSTDRSAAVAESFGAPVRVIRQENLGESVARNRAIDAARGEWIALLDADDRWEPSKLADEAAAIAGVGPDTVCVYSDFYYFDNGERIREVVRPDYHDLPDWPVQMLCHATVHPSAALVRSDAARRVRFPEETRHAEDVIFFAHLRHLGPFLHLSKPLCGYRIAATMQSRAREFNLNSVRARFDWLERHAELYGETQVQEARRILTDQLIEAHDMAFWARNNDVARRCRAYYRELLPGADPLPPMLERRLYPAALMRLKDKWDVWSGRDHGRQPSA